MYAGGSNFSLSDQFVVGAISINMTFFSQSMAILGKRWYDGVIFFREV